MACDRHYEALAIAQAGHPGDKRTAEIVEVKVLDPRFRKGLAPSMLEGPDGAAVVEEDMEVMKSPRLAMQHVFDAAEDTNAQRDCLSTTLLRSVR